MQELSLITLQELSLITSLCIMLTGIGRLIYFADDRGVSAAANNFLSTALAVIGLILFVVQVFPVGR